jgi:phosphoenolpyruvate---glycerone phosphotransferase subunit DhaM
VRDHPAVGLVVVSHAREIADGIARLALAMAPGVRIVPVGGLPDGSLGTDATAVAVAIELADAGAGVVVLADLGGAVIASATALDLIRDPDRVRISDGPVVEGAVVGAVEAAGGGSLDEVLAVTEGARELGKVRDRAWDAPA